MKHFNKYNDYYKQSIIFAVEFISPLFIMQIMFESYAKLGKYNDMKKLIMISTE